MALPVNIEELLSGRVVETERLEFKEGWNPQAVLHTMCAFANDVNNWGGGYIVIGLAENKAGQVFSPKGLSPAEIKQIQKELLRLSHKIRPEYFPIVDAVRYKGKNIVVIWVPGGTHRPYKAAETLDKGAHFEYYIRRNVVRIYPDKILIISYPGPMPPLGKDNINKPIITPPRYRNRRLGDFLKELELTEGRCTGFPKIRRALKANGSPSPTFQTDTDREYFMVTLRINPRAKRMAAEITPEKSEKSKEKSKEKSTEKILRLMAEKPEITTQEIADVIELSLAGIEKAIRILKQQKRLRRVGPDKGGHWLVLNLPKEK